MTGGRTQPISLLRQVAGEQGLNAEALPSIPPGRTAGVPGRPD
ncbi:MAG: hypothetical protein ACTHPS_27730 [Streptosporangiaceae bacterium]